MTTSLHIVHTAAAGAATGPAVVLLHGFTATGAQDYPAAQWADPLAAAGRASLVVDLPGHGASVPLPDGGFTTTQVLAALGEAVAQAATDEIDLVGYSLGGRIGWDLIAASPKPVRRAVLGGVSPQEPFGAVDAAAAQQFFADGTAPADPITGLLAQMMSAPGRDPDSLLSLVTGMGHEPFDPAATPPQVPTLLLAGTEDPMTQGLEDLVSLLPHGQLERLPGDHIGLLRSDAFRDRAFAFLGIWRPSSRRTVAN